MSGWHSALLARQLQYQPDRDRSRWPLAGELDAASADQAHGYVRDAIDTHGGPAVPDVARLSFCDVRGLAALV